MPDQREPLHPRHRSPLALGVTSLTARAWLSSLGCALHGRPRRCLRQVTSLSSSSISRVSVNHDDPVSLGPERIGTPSAPPTRCPLGGIVAAALAKAMESVCRFAVGAVRHGGGRRATIATIH